MKQLKKYFKKRTDFILPLISFGLFLYLLFATIGLPAQTHAQNAQSVTFGSVGDSGGSSNASAVYTTVKNANLDFFLQVGDFSYDQQGGPSGWPTWVKNIVGSVLPFEIVSGNHDDCCIATYVQGLPNKMANLNGTYGQNYYFDYPQTSPIMRVIMISPGGFAPDITWLTNAIDTARSTNIPWVVVGMHRNCITTGQKSCEIGQSLFNLLLSKKVDLILQGHDHNYQRSKQLTCATANTFVASCVANAGPNYVKGAGSVIVLDGAGGNGFYSVNSSDTEAGYFAMINSDTYGFTKYTLTATQITGQFVRAAGGNLSDSFTISGSGSINPNPTIPPATPTPTPKVTASATPKPTSPVATPTLPQLATTLSIAIDMHGIGNSGDNTNPTGGQLSNKSPLHPSRIVTVSFINAAGQIVYTKDMTVIFNKNTNHFEGTVDLGNTFVSNYYVIKIKDQTHLKKLVPGIFQIYAQKNNSLPLISIIAGDANNDNSLTIIDYNLLIGCYSDLLPAVSCDNTKKIATDSNDDGLVNQTDYNLFLREIAVQIGD